MSINNDSITVPKGLWTPKEDNLYTRIKRRRRPDMEFPYSVTINPVLNVKQLKSFTAYLDSLAPNEPEEDGWTNRKTLIERFGTCEVRLNSKSPVKLEKGKQAQTLKAIVSKAIESMFKLDGKIVTGSYNLELYVVRDYGKHDDMGNLTHLRMHHDYNPGEETSEWGDTIQSPIPEYLFCSVITNAKDKRFGWKGGHLIVQADHTTKLHVNFNPEKPHLAYSYPVNEGLCLRNQEAVHMRSGIKSTQAKRDLVIVRMYKQKQGST